MRVPVAFIVGYGPGVGTAVARKLKSEGYSVAVASRSVKSNPDTDASQDYDVGVKLDMARPDDVQRAFDHVERELGESPSVVVYNGQHALDMVPCRSWLSYVRDLIYSCCFRSGPGRES